MSLNVWNGFTVTLAESLRSVQASCTNRIILINSRRLNIPNRHPLVIDRWVWTYQNLISTCTQHTQSYSICSSVVTSPPPGLISYLFLSGMGPMPWTINSEIYPLWARSTGNACAAGVNWTFNILVSLTFLHLAQYITYYGQYQLIEFACMYIYYVK